MMIDLFTPGELMKTLNICKGTELAWRQSGILPPPVKLGRRIYYRAADIAEKFIILNPQQNEPQPNK